jgi:hypothetical protein
MPEPVKQNFFRKLAGTSTITVGISVGYVSHHPLGHPPGHPVGHPMGHPWDSSGTPGHWTRETGLGTRDRDPEPRTKLQAVRLRLHLASAIDQADQKPQMACVLK